MLRLYIARHGETLWNTQNRMQGWKDSKLTEKGLEYAAALGNRLKDVEFNCIYSSPIKRALQTAELICGDRDINIIANDNLREINLGDWEGKTSFEAEEDDREGYEAFKTKPHLYVPKSGESFYNLRDRVSHALDYIIQENKNGEVLIVTHALVIKTMMLIFKGIEVEKLREPPYIGNTSLSIVEIDEQDRRVLLEGDVSHIAT